MSIESRLHSKSDNAYIHKNELYQWIEQEHPDYSETSYRWVVYNLIHSGLITKIDNNIFIKGYKKKYTYGYIGTKHHQIIDYFDKELPNISAVIYEATMLNEWLNHQLARNVIFVEVNKDYAEIIFDKLRTDIQSNLLINPKKDEFTRYVEPDSIVILNLITQAPTNKRSHEIKLEKFIVDLFSEPILKALFSESEMAPMLESMFYQYVIEQKKLFAYAKRRKCDQRIKQFIRQNTTITLWENQ